MIKFKSLALAAAISALAMAPALADPKSPNPNANPNAPGQIKKGAVGAPGPVAGVGLPFLIAAGGYYLIRRHRRKDQADI